MTVHKIEDSQPAKKFAGAQILLVEDDRVHREFVSRILGKFGCVVSVAYDGEDALRLVRVYPFHLILMDIEMPHMNGIEAARVLRDMKRHHDIPDVPIVAISATRDDMTKEACVEAGMVDFIPKSMWRPYWEPTIVEKLTHWLPSGEDMPAGTQANAS